MFTEPLHTLAYLQAQSSNNLQWSLFCPSAMLPASEAMELLEAPRGHPLVAAKDEPAGFQDFYINWTPFLGPLLTTLGNAWRYNTKLEDCADFTAADFKTGDNEFMRRKVGVYDTGKRKRT